MRRNTHRFKKYFLELPNEREHFEDAHVFEIWQINFILIIALIKYREGDYSSKA